MIVWERTIINKKEAGEGPLKKLTAVTTLSSRTEGNMSHYMTILYVQHMTLAGRIKLLSIKLTAGRAKKEIPRRAHPEAISFPFQDFGTASP